MVDILKRVDPPQLIAFIKNLAKENLSDASMQRAIKEFFGFFEGMFAMKDFRETVFAKISKLAPVAKFFKNIIIKLARVFKINKLPSFKIGNIFQFMLGTTLNAKTALFSSLFSFLKNKGGLLGRFADFAMKGIKKFSTQLESALVKILTLVKAQKAKTESTLTEAGIVSTFVTSAGKVIMLMLRPIAFLLEKVIKLALRLIWNPVYAVCKYFNNVFERSGMDKVPLVSGVLAGGFLLAGFFPVAGFFLSLTAVAGALTTISSQISLADKGIKGVLIGTYLVRGQSDRAMDEALGMMGMGDLSNLQAELESTFKDSMQKVGAVG